MNYKIIMFCLVLLGIAGCKRIDKLTQFNIEIDDIVVVPSSTGINLPFNIITPDISTNSESTFEVNDTRKDLVEKIVLTKLVLTINTPTNEDFSFLNSINIYISADGLSEVQVAWKDSISGNGEKTINLDVSNADLQEYIKKDKFSFRLNAVTDEILATDYQIAIHSVFFVDAKILGQ